MNNLLNEAHNKMHKVSVIIIISILTLCIIILGLSFTKTYTKLQLTRQELARVTESCNKNMQFMIDTKQHMNNVLQDVSKENPNILPEIQSNNM